MSTPDGLPPLREVIAAHGLGARKGLGQHFLFDLNLTRRIARVAGELSNATVIEIGPGPGALTRALLLEGAAHVIAIEKDRRCAPVMEEIAARWPGRLTAVEADALKADENTLIEIHGGGRPVKVIANLPYNVGTALLVKWLTVEPWPPWWASLTLMFQKEVAERLVAQPGQSAYGRLAVLAQWRTRPRLLFDVDARAFTPPPKVTSAVVSIEPAAPRDAAVPMATLARVSAAAFGQRRKMLRASLKTLIRDPLPLLEAAGVSPTARAEEIDVGGFGRLAAHLAACESADDQADTKP